METKKALDPMKQIVTGVREVYLGMMARHLPGEAFDLARSDVATQVAFDGVANLFLSLVEYAQMEASLENPVKPASDSIESWEVAYERQRQYWGEHDKTPYMLAELNARREQANLNKKAPAQTSAPFEVVSITSPGYEGWANVIYKGPECEGLPIAMVPPYVARDFRKMLGFTDNAPLSTVEPTATNDATRFHN